MFHSNTLLLKPLLAIPKELHINHKIAYTNHKIYKKVKTKFKVMYVFPEVLTINKMFLFCIFKA